MQKPNLTFALTFCSLASSFIFLACGGSNSSSSDPSPSQRPNGDSDPQITSQDISNAKSLGSLTFSQ